MSPIEKIAFVVNTNKPNAEEVAYLLMKKAQSLGVTTFYLDDPKLPAKALENQDACCVIGGDGTLLSVVNQAVEYDVPVFGINHGKLGFLATLSPKEALLQFSSILSGSHSVQNRTLLSCSTNSSDVYVALNDVFIKNRTPYRLIELEVYCNNELVTSYYSDGLLFSTPTGSTAYNLSAGGPIIFPGTRVFAMTPICPHTLSNRSVIFDSGNTITVKLKHKECQAYIALDGTTKFIQENTFPISVSISDKTFPLLQTPNYSHFKILRNKLSWGD